MINLITVVFLGTFFLVSSIFFSRSLKKIKRGKYLQDLENEINAKNAANIN